MPFQPTPDQELTIDGTTYLFAEHPNAPGMAYGQEGRQAVVYQLNAEDGLKALKVFKPRYRSPFLVSLADHIAPYASIPGLQVCQRTVLTPSRHADILRSFPDLIYAVLMPWVNGPVWQEIMLEKQGLTPAQSLGIAQSLASTLLTMEERGLAHCDLSASNLILAPDLAQFTVGFVDIEGIFAPGLQRPDALPAGSPGYAHKTAPQGLWSRQADRFAGAIIIAEILCWSEDNIRHALGGESFFLPDEVQTECARYHSILESLRTRWGENVVNLFQRAWISDTLTDCPNLGEWLVALPTQASEVLDKFLVQADAASQEDDVQPNEVTIHALLDLGHNFKIENNLSGALSAYQQALSFASPESGLVAEINLLIEDLKSAESEGVALAPKAEEPHPPPNEKVPSKISDQEEAKIDHWKPELPSSVSRERIISGKSVWIAVLAIALGILVLVGWDFISELGNLLHNKLYGLDVVLGYCVIATLGGVSQLIILRFQVRKRWQWILSSAIGGIIVGSSVLVLLRWIVPNFQVSQISFGTIEFQQIYIGTIGVRQIFISVAGMLAGTAVGMIQVELLQQTSVRFTFFWILLTSIAWLLGWFFATVIAFDSVSSSNYAFAAICVIAITGLGITPLLYLRKSIEV